MHTHKYIPPFRVTKGKRFQLKNYDPGDNYGLMLVDRQTSKLLRQGTE